MGKCLTKLSTELAEAHVDWYLRSIRPLLIDHMVHGFKYGVEIKSKLSKIKDRVRDSTIKRPA